MKTGLCGPGDVIVEAETRLARARRSEELARWLREAGRRTRRSFAAGSSKAGTGAKDAQIGSGPRLRADPARLLRLSVAGLLAISYLQYFYFDALLQVYSIHSLIVFILVNGHIA